MGRQILLIGIGQTGCTVADMFSQKMNKDGIFLRSLALDTDEYTLSKVNMSEKIPMIDGGELGTVISEIGEQNIESWFPCNWERDRSEFVKTLDMKKGANQWRMKALLSFCSFLSNEEKKSKLDSVLDEFSDDIELYVVASLAGGTGSGLFLPVTLYVKEYLKNSGRKTVFSNAILAMPAIYENCFSAEQRVKSRANAYAALRELNAVNVTAVYSEETAKHPPVGLKIGEENGVLPFLFDSEKEEYRSSKFTPYDKVILFERIPGVISVDVHSDIIAETAASFCRSAGDSSVKDEKSKTTAVYGGVSLTKIKYPIDSIVKYITKKQLFRFASDEMCRAHGDAVFEIMNRRKEARTYGFRMPDETTLYCNAYVSAVRRLQENSDESDLLLSRHSQKGNAADVGECLLKDSFAGELLKEIYASFECESAEEISKLISPDAEIKKGKGKKTPKLSPQKQFLQTASRCEELLNDYYRDGLKKLTFENDSFADSMISAAADGHFSVLEGVIKNDGRYVHPVYALTRLCVLYNDLKGKLSGAEEIGEAYSEKTTVPASLLLAEEIKKPKTKYAKAGVSRFILCVSEDDTPAASSKASVPEVSADDTDETVTDKNKKNAKNKQAKKNKKLQKEKLRQKQLGIKDISDDNILLIEDMERAYRNITRSFVENRVKCVMAKIGQLIEGYRGFVGFLYGSVSDLRSDVRLCALFESTDNGNVVNIGSSVNEKERLYDAYIKDYFKNSEALAEDDSAIGEKIAALVMSAPSEPGREKLLEMLDVLEKTFEDRLKSTEFYRTQIDKNILQAVMGNSSGKTSASDVSASRVFMGRNVPLAIEQPSCESDRKSLKNVTLAILPAVTRDYIQNELSSSDVPEMFIEKLMYNAGEYRGKACFADNICEREMYIRKEVYNMPLHMVEAVNESGYNCSGYRAYQKALEVSKKQMTQMWNPSVVYKRDLNFPLPYISPDRQKKYEMSVAKAVLYAFMNEEISCSAAADLPDEIYFINDGTEKAPVSFGEQLVQKDDIRTLMLWFYANSDRTERFAARYDEAIRSSRREYPAFNTELVDYISVVNSVKSSDTLNCLWRAFAELIKIFFEKDALEYGGYADTVINAVNSTLLRYCVGNAEEFDEISLTVYNELLSVLSETMTEFCTEKTANDITEYLHSCNCFLRYEYADRVRI